MEPNKTNGRSPISWVPTLYFAMGMPFVVLNMVCVLMFKGLDVSDAQIALWTSIIMFPWTLKPLWSPLLEMYKTKKFFVIVTQIATGCIFGLVALALHLPDFFAVCIALLAVIALSGATHDVAADGVYMASLSKEDQARYIGWQGAFYNIAKIAATGGLVMLAGVLIKHFTGDVSTLDTAAAAVAKRQGTVMAWTVIMAVIGLIMCCWDCTTPSLCLPTTAMLRLSARDSRRLWWSWAMCLLTFSASATLYIIYSSSFSIVLPRDL